MIATPDQIATPEELAVQSPGDRSRVPLSAQLRHSTRAVHNSTEAAFALDGWLANRDTYSALLTMLRGFHVAVEAALGRVEGWDRLTPSIDLAARRRAYRIDEDLARLGRPPPAAPPVRDAGLGSIAEGLGCLYVIEGSGLGGRVIADRARAALGPCIPTAFFADPARNVGREWRALRATLDSFGAGASAAAGRGVIDGAHRTFGAFTAMLVSDRSLS